MGEEIDRLDSAVARIAARRHGVIAVAQLQELGMDKNGVSDPSTAGRSRRRGIHIHRTPSPCTPSRAEPSPSPSFLRQVGGRRGRLLSPNVTYRANIPTTTVPRTIEDLRASSLIPPHLLRRAIRQAELKGHRLDGIETDRTRSDLEAAFLALLERLVVETDFWTYHRGSVAWEDDHARDLDLCSAGYTVLRYDDKQVENEANRVAADVAAALAVSSVPRG